MLLNRRLLIAAAAALVVIGVIVGVRIRSSSTGDIIPRGTGEEFVEQGALFTAPGAVEVPVVTVPLGSDGVGIRPTPFAEADPSSDNAGVIDDRHFADDSGRLKITDARFVDANGPQDLVWTLTIGENGVECRNCAYLVTRLRVLIADVLELPIAGKVTSIVGFEPSRATPGDFAGFGEQVEFVFADTQDGKLAAQSLVNWLLACDETCRARDKSFSDVVWNNQLWSSEGCGQDMATVVPITLYPGFKSGSSDGGDRDAAIDRVVIAAPSHRPFFEYRAGLEVMTAWRVTGCADEPSGGE